jgi:predicted site-specific integrase-resolvase
MPKLETEEALSTPKEMARMLQISQSTLDTWRKKGIVPCVWLGYIIRYERKAVLEALRKVQRKGGSR